MVVRALALVLAVLAGPVRTQEAPRDGADIGAARLSPTDVDRLAGLLRAYVAGLDAHNSKTQRRSLDQLVRESAKLAQSRQLADALVAVPEWREVFRRGFTLASPPVPFDRYGREELREVTVADSPFDPGVNGMDLGEVFDRRMRVLISVPGDSSTVACPVLLALHPSAIEAHEDLGSMRKWKEIVDGVKSWASATYSKEVLAKTIVVVPILDCVKRDPDGVSFTRPTWNSADGVAWAIGALKSLVLNSIPFDPSRLFIDGSGSGAAAAVEWCARYPGLQTGAIVRGAPPDLQRLGASIVSAEHSPFLLAGPDAQPLAGWLDGRGHFDVTRRSVLSDADLLDWIDAHPKEFAPRHVALRAPEIRYAAAYWIRVIYEDEGRAAAEPLAIEATADRSRNEISVVSSRRVTRFEVFLNDALLDLSRDVTIVHRFLGESGAPDVLFHGRMRRDLQGAIAESYHGSFCNLGEVYFASKEVEVDAPALAIATTAASSATESPAPDGGAIDPAVYGALRWRCIGPFRGGRTVAAAGVPGRPHLFYMACNNGGVWRSDDAGRVWEPIFDEQETGSIGALAVAPSAPETIYVGSGEGLQRPDLSTGDGIYKSVDGGRTWTHLGLVDAQQIPAIAVDPRDARRLYVAVLGHPYGPNETRGVFRSTDGGATFQKVLYRDADTGAVALAIDPSHPDTVFAALWASRQGPWENGVWQGPGSGLFVSHDGGDSWEPLTEGLPDVPHGLGRIGFDIARSDPRRMYAMVDARDLSGVYRSDDAGRSWRRVNSEHRLCSRGFDFAEVRVDPKNPDTIYVCDTSLYRSEDGGATFRCIKGSPGGDDYHTVWINPDDTDVILIASDQGAAVSLNRGRTWSSWYNQPTAQFYHVSTDNLDPYWVFGGQQESGSAGVASRGRDGQITFREWHPVGAEEYAYVAPDPLHPDLIYGGKVSRYDRRTGSVEAVGPKDLRRDHRVLRTQPLLFSPVDPHRLYFAAEVLFTTVDGGAHWDVISPDLSREHPEVPESIGTFRTPELAQMSRRGVIYSVAPSYLDGQVIWAGTDDGLIHVTRDGGRNWKDVTPPTLTAWSKVSILDAGRFDVGTCYAAINRLRLDDLRPHVLRTHDFGATWTEIDAGLPPEAPIDTVREDPLRRGLLYCGSEKTVHVSFDDGDRWRLLRLNLPGTSVRDLVVHGDDVVIGTHGRGFWILDDVTPLRQLTSTTAGEPFHLFQPSTATLWPRDLNTDTPLPQDEPVAENPPDGAILDYWLGRAAGGPVVLEVIAADGALVRRFASDDPDDSIPEDELTVMPEWQRVQPRLSGAAGAHRFVWDLRRPAPRADRRRLPISAIWRRTPPVPEGEPVAPGLYTVKLTVDGSTQVQPLTVRTAPDGATEGDGAGGADED